MKALSVHGPWAYYERRNAEGEARIAHLEAELEKLKAKHETLEANYKTSEDSRLNLENNALPSLRTENERAVNIISNLEREIHGIKDGKKAQLDKMAEQVEDLSEELQKMTADNCVLRSELSKLVMNKQATNSKLELVKKRLGFTEGEAKVFIQELEEARSSLKVLKDEVVVLQADKAHLRQQLESRSQHCMTLISDNKRLMSQASDVKAQNTKLEDDLRQARLDIHGLQNQLKTKQLAKLAAAAIQASRPDWQVQNNMNNTYNKGNSNSKSPPFPSSSLSSSVVSSSMELRKSNTLSNVFAATVAAATSSAKAAGAYDASSSSKMRHGNKAPVVRAGEAVNQKKIAEKQVVGRNGVEKKEKVVGKEGVIEDAKSRDFNSNMWASDDEEEGEKEKEEEEEEEEGRQKKEEREGRGMETKGMKTATAIAAAAAAAAKEKAGEKEEEEEDEDEEEEGEGEEEEKKEGKTEKEEEEKEKKRLPRPSTATAVPSLLMSQSTISTLKPLFNANASSQVPRHSLTVSLPSSTSSPPHHSTTTSTSTSTSTPTTAASSSAHTRPSTATPKEVSPPSERLRSASAAASLKTSPPSRQLPVGGAKDKSRVAAAAAILRKSGGSNLGGNIASQISQHSVRSSIGSVNNSVTSHFADSRTALKNQAVVREVPAVLGASSGSYPGSRTATIVTNEKTAANANANANAVTAKAAAGVARVGLEERVIGQKQSPHVLKAGNRLVRADMMTKDARDDVKSRVSDVNVDKSNRRDASDVRDSKAHVINHGAFGNGHEENMSHSFSQENATNVCNNSNDNSNDISNNFNSSTNHTDNNNNKAFTSTMIPNVNVNMYSNPYAYHLQQAPPVHPYAYGYPYAFPPPGLESSSFPVTVYGSAPYGMYYSPPPPHAPSPPAHAPPPSLTLNPQPPSVVRVDPEWAVKNGGGAANDGGAEGDSDNEEEEEDEKEEKEEKEEKGRREEEEKLSEKEDMREKEEEIGERGRKWERDVYEGLFNFDSSSMDVPRSHCNLPPSFTLTH